MITVTLVLAVVVVLLGLFVIGLLLPEEKEEPKVVYVVYSCDSNDNHPEEIEVYRGNDSKRAWRIMCSVSSSYGNIGLMYYINEHGHKSLMNSAGTAREGRGPKGS